MKPEVMLYLTLAIGAALMVLGVIVLVNRVRVLRFGIHRAAYVGLYVGLGAGSMAGGWCLLTGVSSLDWTHVGLLVATSALLRLQRHPGHQWAPSPRMTIR